MREGLHAGLCEGLHAGLHVGRLVCMKACMHEGLHAASQSDSSVRQADLVSLLMELQSTNRVEREEDMEAD